MIKRILFLFPYVILTHTRWILPWGSSVRKEECEGNTRWMDHGWMDGGRTDSPLAKGPFYKYLLLLSNTSCVSQLDSSSLSIFNTAYVPHDPSLSCSTCCNFFSMQTRVRRRIRYIFVCVVHCAEVKVYNRDGNFRLV